MQKIINKTLNVPNILLTGNSPNESQHISKTSCALGNATCPRPYSPVGAPVPHAPLSRRNVAVVSHAQYVLTVTAAPASSVKATVSKVALVTLTYDLLTLKVASKSSVTWATSVPILIFLGLSVLDLGPMNATDRQTSDSIIA